MLEEEDIEGTGEVGDRGEDEEEGMIGVNPADRKEAGAQLLQVRPSEICTHVCTCHTYQILNF